MTEQVFVGLGGNLGDVRARLAAARLALRALAAGPLRASPLVVSAAWGYTEQPDFINQVVGLHVRSGRWAFLDAIRQIEIAHGRDREREHRWGPRTLDIDVLSWPGVVDADPRLTLPHPRLHLRRFVLLPWSAIAPDLEVPGLGRTVGALLQDCSDSSAVCWSP